VFAGEAVAVLDDRGNAQRGRWPAPHHREQSAQHRTTARCPPVPVRWSPAPSQVSISGLSSTSRIPSHCAMAAARSRAMSKSPSTNSNLAPNARMQIQLGRRRKAGCHDGDVEPPAATRPRERVAKVARTRAHDGSRAILGEQARDHLSAARLEAADRIRRLELDAHRAPDVALQRLATVERSVEKNRVDYPTSRLDASSVEARILHGTAAVAAMTPSLTTPRLRHRSFIANVRDSSVTDGFSPDPNNLQTR